MAFLAGIDVTATSTTAEYGLGDVAAVTTSTGTKLYRYVQYESGAGAVASAAGSVAYVYAASGASAGDTAKVTCDLSDSAEVGAGVCAAVIADGSYGWIQVTGQATLTTSLTAGADGDPLTPTGSTDGTLDVSALVTDHVCAIAIDASADLVMCQFPY